MGEGVSREEGKVRISEWKGGREGGKHLWGISRSRPLLISGHSLHTCAVIVYSSDFLFSSSCLDFRPFPTCAVPPSCVAYKSAPGTP